MSQVRIAALWLIVVGILAFSYEGFITFKTREKVIDAGPIQVTAEKTKKIPVAPVLGAVALIGGVTLLLMSVNKP
jgi:hypothetical protein